MSSVIWRVMTRTPAPKAAADDGPQAQRSLRRDLRGAADLRAAQQPLRADARRSASRLNDPYVSHPNVGVGLNYWITNVLAVGANMNWYQGLEDESDLNFHVRRSTRLAHAPDRVPVRRFAELHVRADLRQVLDVQSLHLPVGRVHGRRRRRHAHAPGSSGRSRSSAASTTRTSCRSVNPGLGLRVFLSKWLTVFVEVRRTPTSRSSRTCRSPGRRSREPRHLARRLLEHTGVERGRLGGHDDLLPVQLRLQAAQVARESANDAYHPIAIEEVYEHCIALCPGAACCQPQASCSTHLTSKLRRSRSRVRSLVRRRCATCASTATVASRFSRPSA